MLDDMARFVEVVRAKGFRRAAETLEIPISTLSRRISALEKAVGLRLLHRTTRRIELTEAGQIYFERCQRIVEEARLAHEHLGELRAQPTGVLRVSLCVDFALIYLVPLIVEFANLYPGLDFDFDLTPRLVDLVSERFDIAIRMGKPENEQFVARALATLIPRLYASPGYLKRHGEPAAPAELARHACLSIMNVNVWTLRSEGHSVTVPVRGRFRLNSVSMICRLAAFDQGIILMLEAIVADELVSGRLRPVLPGWQGEAITVYALTETRLLPAKTQRFIEFLRERLGGG
jgi:DNA-binding transcriptional LysR family regulator